MRPPSPRGVLRALLLLLLPLGVLVSLGEARTLSSSLSSLIGRRSPTASFTFSPSTPHVGQMVTFDATASTGSGGLDIWSWQWLYHDGTTDSGEFVQRTYSAPGTYTVRLTVTDFDGGTHTQIQEVTVGVEPGGTATVAPKGTLVSLAGSAPSSQVFTVKNTSTRSITYTLTSQCTGQAVGCSVPSPASLTLGAGQTGSTTVSYSASATAGTGQVRLRAVAPSGAVDEGWINLRVTVAPVVPTPAPVALDSATSIALLERDLCLTIATGDNAAYECGDLRIVHPLPSVRTMNKQRTPTLLYNSQHAEPNPLVAASVRFSPTGGQPTTIRATLTVSGTTPAISFSRTWTPPSGTTWAAGQTRRIVMGHDPAISGSDRLTTLPTGVYPYTLSVDVQAGGQWTPQTPLSGSLVVVNRKSHPSRAASILGIPGWWVAGVEELHYLDVNRTQILWVGGDGSARVYTRGSGQTEWTAPRLEWSGDRITSETVGGVTTYVRHLPGKVTVRFNYAGQHVATVNRLGHQTTFEYTNGKLSTLRVPLPGTGPGLPYVFDYSDPSRITIVAPNVRDAQGVLWDRQAVVTFSNGRVSYIRDSGVTGNLPSFAYVGTTNRISQRTDRRGNTTFFTYDEGQKLRSTRRQMGTSPSGADISLGFFAHESKGSARAVRSDSVFTYVKGPRANVTTETYSASSDTTVSTFWIDRFGAPWRIRNALGHETVLYRNGPEVNTSGTQVGTWPAKVGWMQTPSGLVTTATYTTRGNVRTATAANPYGDGRNATTRYEYTDANWPDFVTRIVPQEGNLVDFGYDAAGNRIWQQDARGSTSRTNFRYYPSGLLKATQAPLTAPDSLVYDAVGNVSEVRSPKGFVTTYKRDAPGRDTLIVTATDSLQTESLKLRQRFVYDLQDRVVRSMTDGAAMNGVPSQSLWVDNSYDEEGNLLSVRRGHWPIAAGVGWIYTTWRYDRANRVVAEVAPDARVDSTFYDRSGNVREAHTRRTAPTNSTQRIVLRMQYDALDRLTQRILPPVVYPYRVEGIAKHRQNPNKENPRYPEYFNNADSGYTIAGDTALYGYDVAGNLTSATNADAQVSRTFHPSGLLESETQRVNTVNGRDFSKHVYTVEYRYDLNGRLAGVKHPAQLGPAASGRDSTTYAYHAHGPLSRVTDALGAAVNFSYDTRGDLRDLTFPGAVYDHRDYDDDGRLTVHTLTAGTGYLRNTRFRYDARNKLLQSMNSAGWRDTLTAKYSGHGHTVHGTLVTYGFNTPDHPVKYNSTETSKFDAMGTRFEATSDALTQLSFGYGDPGIRSDVYTYNHSTGRLLSLKPNSAATAYTFEYDGAGNIQLSTANGISGEDRVSYYAGDGTLRAAEYRVSLGTNSSSAPLFKTFEEYRYDALGRRVWVRARRACVNAGLVPDCRISKLRRTVWQGSQELYEIQMPGDDALPYSAYWENDTATVALPMDQSVSPTIDRNPFFGRVAYANGPGVDQPVSIIRMGYVDHRNSSGTQTAWTWKPEAFSLFPHWSSRGQPEFGTYSNGGVNHCDVINYHQHCVRATWPGLHLALERARIRRSAWHGSLLEDKEDAAGTFYRRNRQYDPLTGQFTQEDPIGLAGGINLYGFANGDAVNYSDPFGLSVCARTPGLRRGIESSVNAEVKWDSNGCVSDLSNITFRGGAEWAENQAIFARLVESPVEYRVAWWRPGVSDCQWGSSCFSRSHNTAYISQDDIAKYVKGIANNGVYRRCDTGRWWQLGPKHNSYGWDLGSLIAHELLGHGASGMAGHDLNSPAITAENRYHAAMGRPLRCSQ